MGSGKSLVSTRVEELREILAPIVEALGLELWGVELNVHARHSLLRIYIDSENGITVDDCALVSGHASSALDVADPIGNAYTLEVSSPGWDRPLFYPEQFQHYVGERVRMKLAYPVQGQRNCTGRLVAVDAGGVEVEVAQEARLVVPFAAIKKANLIVESD